ncbi:MAG: hypothetical protein K5678_00105 [Acetatifactor sp.]|nr:hypothetical protein [Acetatifactor sp.]
MQKVEAVKTALTNKGKQVADKAKDIAEIASLKRQIRTCEDVIKRNELEIGRMIYDQFELQTEAEETGEPGCKEELVSGTKKSCPDRFRKQCTAISNAKRAIVDLNKQIKQIQRRK